MEKNPINKIFIIRVSEVIHVVMKKIWVILIAGAVLAVAGFGVGAATKEQPMYSTTSKLYVTGVDAAVPSSAGLTLGKQVLNSYIEILKSGPVLEQVIENLNLNMSVGQLRNCISVYIPTDTSMLEITVIFPDGEWAKKVADELVVVSAARALEVMGCTAPIVYEEAYVPSAPYNTNNLSMLLFAALGGVAGVGASGFVIVVLYFMNSRFTNPYKVTDRLRVRMLGVVSDTEYQEMAYQSFISNMQFENPKAKVLSFVSATEKEDKYEFIEKAAESLKKMGKQVVLVDTNVRNPKWGAGNRVEVYQQGLETYLRGEISLEEIITRRNGIACIDCREAVANPTELLMKKEFSGLLNQLKNQYDYVLVDTAPLNYVSDAICVAEITDETILVVSGRAGKVAQAKAVLAKLKEHDKEVLGAVLKDAQVLKDEEYFCKEFGKYFGVFEK